MPRKDHRSERALAAAERLYKRKPDATTEEFRKVCERADKATISKLSNREFNASYALPFRRSKALRAKRGTSTKRGRASRTSTRSRGTAIEQMVRLVRERDLEVMKSAGDARQTYRIASEVEDFVRKLVDLAKR